MSRYRTYTAYSIGCAVVWAIIWVVLGITGSDAKRRTVLLVFLGWLIGWTSASIARVVYPAPKSKGP
jgi:hypothetical protein